jgi:hypothetical protein
MCMYIVRHILQSFYSVVDTAWVIPLSCSSNVNKRIRPLALALNAFSNGSPWTVRQKYFVSPIQNVLPTIFFIDSFVIYFNKRQYFTSICTISELSSL